MERIIAPHEDKFGPRKIEKHLFIEWLATPTRYRQPTTQTAFANKYDVSEQTLCNWKNEKVFLEQVAVYRKRRYMDKGSDVLEAVYKKAKSKGDAKEAKLFFEYVEGFSEKKDINVSGDLSSLLKEIEPEPIVNDGTGDTGKSEE